MSSINTSVVISGFTMNLHPVLREGQTQSGQPITVSEKRGLSNTVAVYSANNRHLGDTQIVFDEEPTPAKEGIHSGLPAYAEVIGSTDSSFEHALFTSIQDRWPEFDPNNSAAGEITRYIRLDRVVASLSLHAPSDSYVEAVVGVYEHANFKNVIAYLPISFISKQRMDRHNQGVKNLEKEIADLTTRLETATEEETPQIQAQLDDTKNRLGRLNDQYIAPLAELLSLPEIKTAVGDMTMSVWEVAKNNIFSYANLDLLQKETNFGPYYDMLVAQV